MVMMTQVKQRPAKHVYVYGPPKVGKTKLVGELAEAGYFLDYFDLESGSNTLFTWLSAEAQARVNLIRIPDTKAWPIAIETMLKVSKFLKTPYKICDEHGKIDCPICNKNTAAIWSVVDFSQYTDKHIMVTDSLTQLTNSSINQITKNADEFYKMERDDWANLGKHLDMFLGNIQNSPYNQICITHEIAHESNELSSKERLFPLAGTRNYSRNSAKFFDDVVHMEIYNRAHRAVSSSTATPDVLTGSRSGMALEKLESGKPSLLPIFTGEGPSQRDEAAKLLQGIKK